MAIDRRVIEVWDELKRFTNKRETAYHALIARLSMSVQQHWTRDRADPQLVNDANFSSLPSIQPLCIHPCRGTTDRKGCHISRLD